MPTFGRQVIVYVRDADDNLVRGATISWKLNGRDRGKIENSDGHGTLTIDTPDGIVEVAVDYKGKASQSRLLAVDQQDCTFVFPDLHINPEKRFFERHFAATLGGFFVIVVLFLGFTFNNPTPTQNRLILGLFALACGALATEISGMIKVDLKLGTQVAIGATGALAVFVVLYLVSPSGAGGH